MVRILIKMEWSNQKYSKIYEEKFHNYLEELKHEDVEGINEVISEFKNLKKQGFYKELFNAVNLGRKRLAPGARTSKEEKKKKRLLNLGRKNLSHPLINLPPLTDLISFKMFYVMYTFLEAIYYMNIGRPLDHEDVLNVYFSGIDERIVFNLDQTDINEDVPEPTAKFFQRLKKIQWKDKKTKNLFGKLEKIKRYIGLFIYGSPLSNFRSTEDAFLLFLAGCSAVNDDRDSIIREDVVKAYITYFKLIRTDITKYKAKKEHFEEEGYLVCEKCNEYYKLQPGESPDDFTDECDCGGNLKFYENIEWLLEDGEDVRVND